MTFNEKLALVYAMVSSVAPQSSGWDVAFVRSPGLAR